MMTASSTACIGSTASIMASASSSVSAAMIASTVRLRSFGQKRPVAQQSHGAVCTCRKAFWPSRLAWMTWARDVRKNVEHFQEVTDIGTTSLFPDIGVLVHKAPGDFRELVQARVLAQQERDRRAAEVRQAAEAARIAAAVTSGASAGLRAMASITAWAMSEPETSRFMASATPAM